jgi:hypothetical protein
MKSFVLEYRKKIHGTSTEGHRSRQPMALRKRNGTGFLAVNRRRQIKRITTATEGNCQKAVGQ